MPPPWSRRPRHPAHLLRRVAAALLACGALVLAVRPPAPATVTAAVGPVTVVVVASADLPAGTVLTAGDLTAVELPAGTTAAGSAAAPDGLVGRTLAAPVRRGEAVTDVRLVGPALWAAVPAGQVAAPVRLADLGVAALLRAGDRVDVLAGRPGVPVQVVATGALVLAVGAPADPAPGVSDTGSGLLVLAVPGPVAADLAAASTDATLTVTLGPP
ncbi:Flp pilus assembly protein CpaB [Modestobacter sp. Leaf380]|uniref:Flp pilus assembly protein CpaB n=1 Tax=Modestobacter sp. Leaf380 TaxID=1736356 RepID=UPI0006FE5281|nr:Flp pilus assembly protein CpaB [Modestobacter sp. Leaf380]KQS68456.1 hypothetical protein ASG41_05650 [Modestobacter sp. Leaf380]